MIDRYQRTQFLQSVAQIQQLPADSGLEVAFAGRSNAGKSSALNTLTGQRQLARVSKTPGRTQMINLFRLDEERLLVDLPGYGYAKVPLAMRQRWATLLESYFVQRRALRGLIILMDIRHPLTDLDQQLLDACQQRPLPAHVLLTKADKLKRGPAMGTLQHIRHRLSQNYPEASVQLFSAQTRQGLDELGTCLDRWFELS